MNPFYVPFEEVMERLLAAALFGLAGFVLCVSFLGRILFAFPSSIAKTLSVKAAFILLTIVPLLFGYINGASSLFPVPAAILLAALVLEIKRIRRRSKFAASPPVETVNTSVSILHPFTTFQLSMRRYEVPLRGLNTRIRVVHISDIHINRWTARNHLPGAMDQVASLEPDLLFFTGDFASPSRNVALLPNLLRKVHARLGCFAVLGNHDFWEAENEVSRILADCGIERLADTFRRLSCEKGGEIIVAGFENPWSGNAWSPPPNPADQPVFILTHTADNIFRLAKTGASMVFAGHYHGGHLALPYYGSVVIPSKLGRLFDHGHFLVENTHLFVTSGLGTSFPAVRFYCKPEILVTDCLPMKKDALPRP